MRRTLLLRSALGLTALGLWADPAHAAMTLSSEAAADLEVKVLANGLSQPTDVAELPDGRVVITQRLGAVVVVEANGDQVESGTIAVDPEFGEQGLLGVVADPDFATNHYLYFYASAGTKSEDPVNKHKVFRIVLGDDGMLGERTTIIDKGLRASRSSVDGGASNHNGGGLQIYKGKLFLSVGDTGHNKTPPNNELGTCLNATNGKILRVNLDGSVPDDNPLSSETMVTGCDDWNTPTKDEAPEKKVFAWGFRNPYRFWIDPKTSRMWVGDVGETTREEISVGSPIDGDGAGAKGEHYGWPFYEGTTKYTQSFPATTCMDVKPARACIAALFDYGHSESSGPIPSENAKNNCVIGGLIADGCGWAAPWNARYLFGDNGSGRIWSLDVNADRSGAMASSVKSFATSQGVGSFRMGASGTLYVAEVSGGVVDKVTPKGLDPTMCGGSSGGTGGMGAGGASSGGANNNGGRSGGNAGTTNGGNGGTQMSGGRDGGGGTSTGGTGTSGASMGGTSPAMGGTSSTMGGTSAGGTTSTGGGSTAGTKASGGSTSTAGNGAANAAGAGGSGGDDKSGCGCRVGGDAPSSTSLVALSGLLGLMAFGRRRSRARR
jgi:MYXO-CTERM domain-containing protein